MLRVPKRLKQIHRLLDDELPLQQREILEREIAADRGLLAEYRKAEQIGEALKEATSVLLSDDEAVAFQRRLRERIRAISPITNLFSLLLSLWDVLSFPSWRLAVAGGMVAALVLLFPVSRLVFQPEIGLEPNALTTIETDIPDARILILSGGEGGTDRVWILAGDTS